MAQTAGQRGANLLLYVLGEDADNVLPQLDLRRGEGVT